MEIKLIFKPVLFHTRNMKHGTSITILIQKMLLEKKTKLKRTQKRNNPVCGLSFRIV